MKYLLSVKWKPFTSMLLVIFVYAKLSSPKVNAEFLKGYASQSGSWDLS